MFSRVRPFVRSTHLKKRKKRRKTKKGGLLLLPFQKWEKDKKTKGWRREKKSRKRQDAYLDHPRSREKGQRLCAQGYIHTLYSSVCVCVAALYSPKYNLTMRVLERKRKRGYLSTSFLPRQAGFNHPLQSRVHCVQKETTHRIKSSISYTRKEKKEKKEKKNRAAFGIY